MTNPRSTAGILGHPLHVMLVPIPITCFVGTLVTDIAYRQTSDPQWAIFSSWLLLAGILFAAMAALAGITDFLGEPRIRALTPAWIHGLGNVCVLLLAIVNAFVHSADGFAKVVPEGLVLSAATVLLLLATGWNGWTMVYRHAVGVSDDILA